MTEPSTIPPSPEPFTPVAESQRIQALDVVRGFALLGIFLMNIEWFNRPVASMSRRTDPSPPSMKVCRAG